MSSAPSAKLETTIHALPSLLSLLSYELSAGTWHPKVLIELLLFLYCNKEYWLEQFYGYRPSYQLGLGKKEGEKKAADDEAAAAAAREADFDGKEDVD